jgi:hypothetical protein
MIAARQRPVFQGFPNLLEFSLLKVLEPHRIAGKVNSSPSTLRARLDPRNPPAAQVCTGVMLHGYPMIKKLCGGLQAFMQQHNFQSIAEFKGEHPSPSTLQHVNGGGG